MRVLDELLAPLTERLPRQAFQVDPTDGLAEFFGGRGNRVARLLERLTRALQVSRVRLLDQVDHVVEAVPFEAHTRHPESDLSLPWPPRASGSPTRSRPSGTCSRRISV